MVVEVAVDAVFPGVVGEEPGRLVDDHEVRQALFAKVAQVLPERQRAHRVAGHHGFFEPVVIEQILQVAGHARGRRNALGDEGMAAVAAGVPAKNPVARLEGGQEGVPVAVGGGPAMQQHQRRAVAGNLQVDLFAIVGEEVVHGAARVMR